MVLAGRSLLWSGLVSFIAWSLAVHWVPSLRFVGYAFVAGVASSAAALCFLLFSSVRDVQDDDHVLQGRPTTVAFVAPQAWKKEIEALKTRVNYQRTPAHPQSSTISASIDEILELIERDFISSWYSKIAPSTSFINEVDKILRVTIADLQHRLSSVDLVQIGVARIVPIITDHLKEFYNAEKLVREEQLERHVRESQEHDLAVASKYRNGKLHPAAPLSSADPKPFQQQYLREVMGRLVMQAVPAEQIQSQAVLVLIKELLTCAVAVSIMQICVDPDTWNQIIEAYGQAVLQDRKSVRKLRAALDEHASPGPKSKRPLLAPGLRARDSERNFERFIRAIRQCKSLPDARRLRSDISAQLKKDAAVDGQDQVYLRRLEIGSQLLDQRIAKLEAGAALKRSRSLARVGKATTSAKVKKATLTDILRDPTGLSYFMEFMDRQGLTALIQFWLAVDGLPNPLEHDLTEDDKSRPAVGGWAESDRNDLIHIRDAYLSKPELKVAQGVREAVNLFLQLGAGATATQFHRARQAILKAQSRVLQEMRDSQFPAFKKSDLFFRYLTSDVILDSKDSADASPTRQARERSPSVLSPTLSQGNLRGNPFRRAATSHIDTRSSETDIADTTSLRRPLDDRVQTPLYEEGVDADPLSLSVQSIDSDIDSNVGLDGPDREIVQAMEEALNDIIENAPETDDAKDGDIDPPDPGVDFLTENSRARSSMDLPRRNINAYRNNEKPSIASLGLVHPSSRIGVFSDDDLFPEEEIFPEDEHDDPEEPLDEKVAEDAIQEAAPGDLVLTEAVSVLSAEIEKLVAQNAIVKSLTLKAELTNNNAELRILRKSKASLEREIQRKELQRQQYMLQESDNNLYGRAMVKIKSIMVGTEEDGHEFAIYLIEVSRHAGEQMPVATWVVARRYSEFHDLHQRLRSKYSSVRPLDFPRRRVVMKLQRDFLSKRQQALEKYLRELLLLPEVCRSRDLRAFLSQQGNNTPNAQSLLQNNEPQDVMSRLYNSLTTGVDDILGNIPVFDQLSVAGQNLIAAASQQLNSVSTNAQSSQASIGTEALEAEAELNAFEGNNSKETTTTAAEEPFVKPICDIFLEVFELNRGNNWLRGRAVVVILHQLLGGTIERKIRDNAKRLLAQDDMIAKYIRLAQDTIWPEGRLRLHPPIRTPAVKALTRTEANLALATLIPDVAGSVVGRTNAQAASRKVFAAINNPILNAHLIFTIFDEIVDVLFDPSTKPSSTRMR